MPIFNYTAKDSTGQYHRGEIETTGEFQAATILRRKKLIVISIKSKKDSQEEFFNRIMNKISFDDQVIFTRQLSTMISAGLVLSEALDVLADQQTNLRFKKIIEEVSSDIKGGMDFSKALEKHPEVFPPIYCKLVKAGQSSGKLDIILNNLANNLEKQREFKSKVKGAMIYPVVVMGMMVVVMLIMIFFVIPKLMGLYKESGMELPLPTKIMLGFSGFMLGYWWLVLFILILMFVGFQRYRNTPEGKFVLDKLLLKVPVFGRINSLVFLTDFTRTFALLISAGLPILESIKIVSDIVGNLVYKDSLDLTYKAVERGLPFSSQLLATPVFPKLIGHMVKTGEETGKMDTILFKVADYFESETDNSLKNITTLIEPIILIVLAVGVATLVLSIIMPIYQLTTNIK